MSGVVRGLAVGACLLAAGCGATGGAPPSIAKAPVIGRMFDGHPGFARPDAPPPPSVAHLYLAPRTTEFADDFGPAPVYAEAPAYDAAPAQPDVVRLTLREAIAMPAPDVRFEPAGAPVGQTRTLFVRLGEEGRLTRRQTSDIAVDPGARTYAAAAHDIAQCWRAADEQRPDPVGAPPPDLTLTDRLNAMVDIRGLKACLEGLGYEGVAISEPPHPTNGPFGAAARPSDPNALTIAAAEARTSVYDDPARERPIPTELPPELRRETTMLAGGPVAPVSTTTSARLADLGGELGRAVTPEGAPAPLIEPSPMRPMAVANSGASPATLRAEDDDPVALAAAETIESALAGGPAAEAEPARPVLAPIPVPVRRVADAPALAAPTAEGVSSVSVAPASAARLPTLDALTAARTGVIERRRDILYAPMSN